LEFDDYVRLRGVALVRLARLLTGDRGDGEDLAQDVLARAFVRWDKIVSTDSPEAYLRQMVGRGSFTTVRWQPATGVWVQVSGDMDQAAAMAVATEVSLAEVHRCAAPFRLSDGTNPADWPVSPLS
jgi:DNA-directed RNA polymerase specialized sigma24 family protein